MSLQKLMINYAAYNLWANNTYVEWLKLKPIAFLEQVVPSSYPCIAKTIVHILETEKFWLSVLRADSDQVPARWGRVDCSNLEALDQLIDQSEKMYEYVSMLSEQKMIEECNVNTSWVKGDIPRYELIQHCFNHSTYHRGQVITIGRIIGLTDPPMTDYNYYNMVVKAQNTSNV